MESKGFSRRQRQVSENVRQALCRVFLSYSFLDGEAGSLSVTISEVQMSRDLRQARVYCVSFGGSADGPSVEGDFEVHKKALIKRLNDEAPLLQAELKGKFAGRFLPKLRFYWDTSFERAQSIQKTLYDVMAPQA